ncbi:tRNA (adenosine(37)-N6)-threonylcarbamoyltransferase complex dimerization subunit type 1 TsaB [Saccharibacter sp. 17.LH.SD]|uniref:tRNA (adenosine(37)-N6)-threonylcarbamoyltransferase complex dimerization subunit type 1 TsaB n=1 Tax=Saccharibacter sp. 17.LH.SD TaxID=2689393 RepID=UPI00136ABFE9|nr:tRNA (adenosine(37)-N6)-threonylcarbamoyltransferase complex dimerization subunit type 1 TsaB [Saccharibacter sp. 17.LH.SD]MXV45292.1 tRNA (adenosine(37)-N6)-threonylcarbamoyltransferase complex dimerization subunit type 1 TsaB [Saccharibacter sp. 17.LH.SD]
MFVIPKNSLILNGAGAGKGQSNLVALLEEDKVIASHIMAGRGASERFAPMVREMLSDAGWTKTPEWVVAVVGPGSFTGLRASLSLAAGLVRGWSCRGIGVRLGDAIRKTVKRDDVTILCLARRGRVFVDEPQSPVYALSVDDVRKRHWSAVAGDAVVGSDALPELTAWVQEKNVECVPCVAPDAKGIFLAAECCETLALTPLYVDPPEAKPPAGGLRPVPV